MTVCRACGVALCDCPDLAFQGLTPSDKAGTGVSASPAGHITGSGRNAPAISNPVPSGRTKGSASGVAPLSGSAGAHNSKIPLHEDADR